MPAGQSAERLDIGQSCPVDLAGFSTPDLIKAMIDARLAEKAICSELEDRAAFAIGQALGIDDLESIKLGFSLCEEDLPNIFSFHLNCAFIGCDRSAVYEKLSRHPAVNICTSVGNSSIEIVFDPAKLGPAKLTDVAVSPRTEVEQLTLGLGSDAVAVARGEAIARTLGGESRVGGKKPD